LKSAKWADFNGGPEGGDLISLFASIHGVKNSEAHDILARDYGFQGGGIGLSPPRPAPPPTTLGKPPKSTPVPSFEHYKYGAASDHWTYPDFDRSVLFYTSRYDPPGEKKQIIPWTWDTQKYRWVNQQFPSPRPLFGLDELARLTDAPVLIVEGEKAAMAARKIVGDKFAVISWPGGGNAIEHVDWSPLFGRRNLLWPDADVKIAETDTEAEKARVKTGQFLP
jgi:putative DNA primase/helicase